MAFQKSDFDVTDPAVAVRLMAGVFYVPHALFKLNGLEGAAALFGRIGFHPPMAWVGMAIAAELACAVALTLNIQVKWMGLVSAFVMLLAGYAVVMTKGPVWLWNFGGVEYIAFWGVASLALAAQAWKREYAAYGRVFLLWPSLERGLVKA